MLPPGIDSPAEPYHVIYPAINAPSIHPFIQHHHVLFKDQNSILNMGSTQHPQWLF